MVSTLNNIGIFFWSRAKDPEFPIVVWNWRSVIGVYGVGCVAPKRPQVFLALRAFVFVVFGVVVVFTNLLSPVFLANLYFYIKNLFETKNSCVLLAPAIKESTLERAEGDSKTRDTLPENWGHPKTNVKIVSPCSWRKDSSHTVLNSG